MSISPWQETEITLTATREYANPYTDVQVWALFIDGNGQIWRRPAFWDGGKTWRVRFAAPAPGRFMWRTLCDSEDPGLIQHGELLCEKGTSSGHRFYEHGFWRMSPGGRNLMHADGTSALMAADTAWGLPWRATTEQCQTYASDRHAKGFNAVLLMSVQPDMDARGPRERNADEGFDVAFEDLAHGHLNQLNPEYFQYFDKLVEILVANEIVPVYQPVFHGFGWKGLLAAGRVVLPAEYARYCRYLVARYGARPAIYLVGGDGSGYEPNTPVGGDEVETWDCYKQPAGIHYRPHADNCAWQASAWLDFQWCQTGHTGEHIPERVADMWRNTPIKAVANGEPTYENGGRTGKAAGWWQGHEAWSNLCAGGTMGVVYGAGSMWQWLIRPDEPGQSDFFRAPGASWREALDFEGSRYVGLLPRILEGLPFTDMAPNWQVTLGRRGLLVPNRFFVCYTEDATPLRLFGEQVPRKYRVVDPRTGDILQTGERAVGEMAVPHQGTGPRIVICCDEL